MDIQESNFKKWFSVFSVGMFFFYEYIQMTIFNSIPKQLLTSFHISAFSLGKLAACYFLMQIILLFPAGILLDRFSVKNIVVIAMSISIIGTLLFSTAHSFYIAAFARLLSGVGGAFAFLSCIKLASQLLPKKLALAIGLLVTLAVFGGFIAQAPFAFLVAHTSWRLAIRILSCVGILILINIIMSIQNIKEHISNTKTIRKIFSEIKMTLTNTQTLLSGIYISLMNFPVCILGALWGGLYLEETRHLNNILATFIASMLFIGIIIGSPLFGFLSESIFKSRKKPMLIGAILSLLTISLIIFTDTQNIYYLSTLFLLLGIVSSAQCIGYPVIVENNKIEFAATATSVASVIIMGGSALVKILFGWILDDYSTKIANGMTKYSAHAFQSAMLILFFGFIFAIIATFFIRETLFKGVADVCVDEKYSIDGSGV